MDCFNRDKGYSFSNCFKLKKTMGKFLYISTVVLLATMVADVHSAEECPSCVAFNNKCYNISHLFDLEATFRNQIVIPKMGILRADNILYFSFEPKLDDTEYYKIGFVKLDNITHSGVLSGGPNLILNFGTFDVDQKNAILYLGGSDGIFMLDTNSRKLTPYSSRGDTISNVFFKNNVYFSRMNEKGIVVKKGDSFQTLFEDMPIKNFIVNKDDVVVMITKFGLYVAKGENKHRLSQNAFFRGLTVDLDGEVYAWWIDGIYKVTVDKNLQNSSLNKVASMSSIGVMTFDNENNILFTSDRGLYKLIETTYDCANV